MASKMKRTAYGCSDYRKEMILLALKKRLNDAGLSAEERRAIMDEIQRLESETGLD